MSRIRWHLAVGGLLLHSAVWQSCLLETGAQDNHPSPREMLELVGIDAQQVDQWIGDRDPEHAESQTLHRLLFQWPRFGRDKIEAWREPLPLWSELAEHPGQYRARVFQVAGRATGLTRVPLRAQDAELFQFAHYDRVRLEVPDSPHPVSVCVRSVPAAWERRESLDEPAGFVGLFLRTGAPLGAQRELVFLADRIAWYPDRVEPDRSITASHVWLSQLGMDVGLFDEVRQTNRQGLGGRDRECFYQLLSRLGRWDTAMAVQRAQGPADLARLLTEPEVHQGQMLTVEGVARRVQRVAVDDPEIRHRFGFDHFYQIEVFVSLDKLEVVLGREGPSSEGPVFRNSYPVTCCTLALPQGLPAEDDVHVPVQVAGVFLKLWAYQSEFVSAVNKGERQPGPLLIAATPQVVPVAAGRSSLTWIAAAVLLAAFLVLGLCAVAFQRSERTLGLALRRQQLALEPGRSLEHLKVEEARPAMDKTPECP